MASFASQAGYNVDFGRLFAAVVITVVPVLIVYAIFQRQLQGSVTAGNHEVAMTQTGDATTRVRPTRPTSPT